MAKKVLTGFTPETGDIIDRIANEDTEARHVKEHADMKKVLSSCGVTLQKKGNSLMGLCPFHDDHEPSLSVDESKKVFHCFGCGEKGDLISFVRKHKGMGFKEALSYIKANSNGSFSHSTRPERKNEKSIASSTAKTKSAPVKTTITLHDVQKFYHTKLAENEKAADYLEKRGIYSGKLYKHFGLGFSDGSLEKAVSKEQKTVLTEKGIYRETSKEHFSGCITVPLFDEDETITGFYGRSINAKAKPSHLYQKGQHRGLVNRKALTAYRDRIVLTESVVDAISLFACGVLNVIPCYGTNGFTDVHLKALKDNLVKQVVIAFDSDEAGKKASDKLKDTLLEEGFSVKVACPKNHKDWNDEVVNGFTKVDFNALLEDAETVEPELEEVPDFKVVKDGPRQTFIIRGISYRLLGVKEVFVSSLRVNIRAEFEGEKFIDNVDLYSARSRSGFSANLSMLFDLEAKRIENDLVTILEYLEAEREKALHTGGEADIVVTEEERNLGIELLQSPDLFDRITSDLETLGYVGEDVNKKLVYLAASSRKLDDPVSVIVLSESAAGKSFLIDTVRKCIPSEDVLSMTSLSDQALNYLPEDALLHKFLVMGEAVHSEPVEHQIREMLSAKELSRLVTMKDPKTGDLTSRTVKKKVVVSAVMSSTNYDLNAENASRCFVVNTDESVAQTRRIHEAQREKYSLERYRQKAKENPRILKQHQAAQRLLTKRVIVNPYAEKLSFPDTLMRSRRDHERFIDLIACVCFLRQFQKEEQAEGDVSFICCDLEDYTIAYEIMKGILPATLTSFPKSAISLYEQLRSYAKERSKKENLAPEEISMTQKELRDATGNHFRFVQRYLKVLVEYEYIRKAGFAKRGSRQHYYLFEDKPIELVDLSVIPTPETMALNVKNA